MRILAVQELHPVAVEEIVTRFDHHALAPDPDVFATGVAMRHPGAVERLPHAYRRGWSVRLDPADWAALTAALRVVCVHMANPLGWPWWRSGQNRRHQLDAIVSHVGAVVLVGDFNAGSGWPVYRKLTADLEDGPSTAGTAAPTWRLHGRGRPRLRIDHVLVRGVTVHNSATHVVPGADHLAVVADISVP